jgi:spermidine synthase
VKYRLLTGLAAGAMIAFWNAAHTQFFPAQYWGIFPLVLGIIPFAAALLAGRPLLLGASPGALRRFLPAALALLLPAALMGAYFATDALAFVDGRSSIIPLLALALIYGIGAGLPLDALAVADAAREDKGDRLPWLLLGAGFGYLGMSVLFSSLDLRILWLVQAAAALPLILRFSAEKAADEKAFEKEEHTLRMPSPWPVVQSGTPLLAMFALPFFLQAMTQIPAFSADMISRIPAALLIAAGLGWQTGLMTTRRAQGVVVGIVALVFASGLLINLASSYVANWYPAIYSAYYQGAPSDFEAQMLSLHLLGAVFFAAMGLAHARKPRTATLSPTVTASLLAGGTVAYLLLRSTVFFTWVSVGLGGVLALLSFYLLMRRYRRETAWVVVATVWAAHLLLLSGIRSPGYHDFFNPQGFQIVSEEATPGGTMTFLRSRDYDDRFHALFWNEQKTLTQASRAVQSDLYRMGHLPMLMAPENAKVLVLGLGTSLPIEAVRMHAPVSVTCVEPSAAVLRLSDATRNTPRPRPWLRDVRLHNERIMAYLARTDEKADVIISAEPFAEAGPAPQLLTEEWFAAINAHLSDDGVMAQWLSLARMDLEAMRPVFAAALAVFPSAEIWITSPDPENAMVGILASKKMFSTDQPSRSRLEELIRRSTDMQLHFRRIELGSYASLLSSYGMDHAALGRLAQGVEAYTMFTPVPRRIGYDPQAVFMDVNRLLGQRTPPDRLLASVDDSTRTLASALFQQRPLVMRAKAAVLGGDDSSAVRLLDELLVSTPANEEAARVLGDIFLRQAAGYVGAEQFSPALTLITRALQLTPVSTYLLRLLMITSFNVGDRESSGLSIDGIKRLDPTHAGFRDNQATIRAREGATDDALLLYENAITLDQSNEEFYCNMASFHYSQKRIWEAMRVLDQATQRAYYPAKAWYLKGMFYAEQGQIAFSREAYEEYLKAASPLDPYRAEVEQRLVELQKFEER